MNWKTYKTLSPELKEEYDFKFKNKPEIRSYSTVAWIVLFLNHFVMFGMIIMMANELPEKLPGLAERTPEILEAMSLTLKVLVPIMIFTLVADVVMVFIYFGREYWWMKKNKIKKINWWSEWKEKTQKKI